MLKLNNHEFEISDKCGGYFSDCQTWICKKCGARIQIFDDVGDKMLDRLREETLKIPRCLLFTGNFKAS